MFSFKISCQYYTLTKQLSSSTSIACFFLIGNPQGPDQDLSACTDQPRVKTRVNQHNRFTQLKEKCSEIITKNVRNKAKPLHTPSPPRPNSFSHHTKESQVLCKANSLPDRRATYHTTNRHPKTYELKDVNDIGEGFEIINIDDCLSGDEGHHHHNHHRVAPQVEPLDLSEKNRSVESLDSGCDIETPRANQAAKFQRLSVDESSEGNFNENKVLYKKSVSVESGDTTGISVVCNIEVISDKTEDQIPENQITGERHANACPQESRHHQEPKSERKSEESQSKPQLDESESEDDPPLQFSEIFKLFEPSRRDGEEADRYAKHLRNKLAWKLATERVMRSEQSGSKEGSHETSSDLTNQPQKPSKTRSECPVYHDPELEDFISRCFAITQSIHDGLIGENQNDLESEESLLSCFVPKKLVMPELAGLDCGSVDSVSLDDSLSWSDGEYLDVND